MEHKVIKAGDYVIIQRQNYTKLVKIKENGRVTLGNDVIEVDAVLGQRHYLTFRMIPQTRGKRLFTLKQVDKLTTTNKLSVELSGKDNRNINDDSSSQGLTKAEIEALRDQASSSSNIVEQLVANSKTFSAKTEYSQQKYLKKKEKKYFEFIQVRRPTIRLLTQMLFRQDPAKTLGLRIDDLSQILVYANVHSEGNYLLYDSGTSGLMAAAIMNAMGANTSAQLVHAHPGNECQKNAFLAMQFPSEQKDRCTHVNLYSVLRCYYQENGCYNVEGMVENNETEPKKNEAKVNGSQDNEVSHTRKRKLSDADSTEPAPKKKCWQLDNEKACRVLRNMMDSVIIVAKEHPTNIVKELEPFLKVGRAIVVFSLVKEPLQDLYFYLKSMNKFIAIRLSSTFMRNYQVLPERTHPEISMNFGGYILSAFKMKL